MGKPYTPQQRAIIGKKQAADKAKGPKKPENWAAVQNAALKQVETCLDQAGAFIDADPELRDFKCGLFGYEFDLKKMFRDFPRRIDTAIYAMRPGNEDSVFESQISLAKAAGNVMQLMGLKGIPQYILETQGTVQRSASLARKIAASSIASTSQPSVLPVLPVPEVQHVPEHIPQPIVLAMEPPAAVPQPIVLATVREPIVIAKELAPELAHPVYGLVDPRLTMKLDVGRRVLYLIVVVDSDFWKLGTCKLNYHPLNNPHGPCVLDRYHRGPPKYMPSGMVWEWGKLELHKFVYTRPELGDKPDKPLHDILHPLAVKYDLPTTGRMEFHHMGLLSAAMDLMDKASESFTSEVDGPSLADFNEYNVVAKMMLWPMVSPSLAATFSYNSWASMNDRKQLVLPSAQNEDQGECSPSAAPSQPCSLGSSRRPSVLPKVGVDIQVQTDVATIATIETIEAPAPKTKRSKRKAPHQVDDIEVVGTPAPKIKAPRQKTKWVDPATCSILPFVQRRA